MKWTKENTKEDGICYTCGPVRIEPITGDSYYKWFLNGVMGNKKTFHTLKVAKEYATYHKLDQYDSQGRKIMKPPSISI